MALTVQQTGLPEVLLLVPQCFEDARGFLFESYQAKEFADAVGRPAVFVQENHTRSFANVLRGIHYQLENPQAKLVRVLSGVIFDVAVDLRRNSPNFGKWTGHQLSAENRRQLWVPEGFGHAFLTLSPVVEVEYKMTAYRHADSEKVIAWNDPDLGIKWPDIGAPILSDRDSQATFLKAAEVFA